MFKRKITKQSRNTDDDKKKIYKPFAKRSLPVKFFLALSLFCLLLVSIFIERRFFSELFKKNKARLSNDPIDAPCNVDNIEAFSFQPGWFVLPYKKNSKIGLVYSYIDKVEIDSTIEKNQIGFFNAIQWVNSQPPLIKFSDNEFLKMLHKVHSLISPQYLTYRNDLIFLKKYHNLSLFENKSELNNLLTDEELSILEGIKFKLQDVVRDYKHHLNSFNDSVSSLLENLAAQITEAPTTFLGHINLPVKYQFNNREKQLIKDFYNIKPKIPSMYIENSLREGFNKIMSLYKFDPARLASHMHMLIVDIHAFTDGNGRTARAFLNYIRHTSNLPIIIFPSFEAYDNVIHESLEMQDYDVFNEYINELLLQEPATQAEQLIETCNYLVQYNCNDPGTRNNYVRCFDYMQKLHERHQHSLHLKQYRHNKQQRLREIRKRV